VQIKSKNNGGEFTKTIPATDVLNKMLTKAVGAGQCQRGKQETEKFGKTGAAARHCEAFTERKSNKGACLHRQRIQ
jgi:hypothetical protein